MPNFLWEICKPVLAILLYLLIVIVKFLWKILATVVMIIFNAPELLRTDALGLPHDVAYYESLAQYLGSIRLSRYEAEEGTYIYVHGLDYRWNTAFKALLFEGRGPISRTQCFVYLENLQNGVINVIQITPPVSVDFVNEIFGRD